jgi:O-antigen/teichoic acid export membrane protein
MTLNFVTKLPLFKELITGVIYDSIIIVINKLTKYVYFIPYLKSFSAEDLAYIFYKYIMANHGFP